MYNAEDLCRLVGKTVRIEEAIYVQDLEMVTFTGIVGDIREVGIEGNVLVNGKYLILEEKVSRLLDNY